MLLCAAVAAQPLPSWDFTASGAEITWAANEYLQEVALRDGALEARGVGHDPIFHIGGIDFPAAANQFLVLRIAADRPGRGEVFFSGTLEGAYQGFSQSKSVGFQVGASEGFQDIAIFPFWQAEGRILQLRLDLYDGAHFRIAGLRVEEIPPMEGRDVTAWNFKDGTPQDWTRFGDDGRMLWGMLQGVDAGDHGWLALQVMSSGECAVEARWAARQGRGYEAVHAPVRAGEARWYNVELQGEPQWSGDIAAVGLHLPPDVELLAVQLTDAPVGPAEFVISYFGPENGVNRAGQKLSIMARVENWGGATEAPEALVLDAPGGVQIEAMPEEALSPVAPGEKRDLRWTVRADAPGEYALSLQSKEDAINAVLRVMPPATAPPADYVPEPTPVETVTDVCAYYFPGWGNDSSWAPIRNTAPQRKPVLGYYDEANSEVVDWQIKWAVENGITCFLVDWYWVAGSQHLTHWFEAYREARYRDELQVAIMWANHNPPKTHTMDDWRAVTQEWIDHYFNLPTYYAIDGMPALFFWSPVNLRDDLGGSEAVAQALAMSQQMAKEAGHKGIAFVALFDHDTPQQAERLAAEGYYGATNYHEWGDAEHVGDTPMRFRFEDVVKTSPAAWARREANAGALRYFPVADTGWDSRPWHGTRARVFDGRTPALWEQLLIDLKTFAVEEEKPFVVLGPLNEWGEGSYIEPATEYDFAMYEAIRRVFAKGEPSEWPVNIAPGDVALGPYDFPPMVQVTVWDFEDGPQGWSAMMGIDGFSASEGALRFSTATHDAALNGPVVQIGAATVTALEITLRSHGGAEGVDDRMQLFWSDGGSTSEAQSMRMPVVHDGEWRTCRFDLGSHPRWRGTITRLRFDPSNQRSVSVEIGRVAFVMAEY
jgi:hypothetical protein